MIQAVKEETDLVHERSAKARTTRVIVQRQTVFSIEYIAHVS